MANNKAQVTWIIVIGIFILIVAALIFYIANYYKGKIGHGLEFEKSSIQNYINLCVKNTAENGLKTLGKQGGYIKLENPLETPNGGIAFLLKSNASKVPTIENIESELSLYMKNNLNDCLKEFEDFKKQGWGVEKGELNSKARINLHDVTFEVLYPIKVRYKDETIEVERSLITINVRLRYIYELINKIFDFRIKNSNSIDRTELANYNFNIKVLSHNNFLIYVIDDKKSPIANQPYRFMFALDFS